MSRCAWPKRGRWGDIETKDRSSQVTQRDAKKGQHPTQWKKVLVLFGWVLLSDFSPQNEKPQSDQTLGKTKRRGMGEGESWGREPQPAVWRNWRKKKLEKTSGGGGALRVELDVAIGESRHFGKTSENDGEKGGRTGHPLFQKSVTWSRMWPGFV